MKDLSKLLFIKIKTQHSENHYFYYKINTENRVANIKTNTTLGLFRI